MSSPSTTAPPTFTASGVLRAAMQHIEGRHINGEEADDFYDEIQTFEGMHDEYSSDDRNLLKEAHAQLKLHGFRVTPHGLQYNMWKDTFLPKPVATPSGDITNASVVAWYHTFMNGKEMDADAAWLFTQWKVTLADETINQEYIALWEKAFDVLQWDLYEGEQEDEDAGFSLREEIGVNGGNPW